MTILILFIEGDLCCNKIQHFEKDLIAIYKRPLHI